MHVRVSPSILLLSRWLGSGPPSTVGPRRLRAGHPGWGRRGELEWKAGWYGFAEPETSYLETLADVFQLAQRLPRTLENIQADPAQAVDVWVVNLGKESDLGGCHGVVIRQEQLELEDTAYSGEPASRTERRYVPS